MAQQAYKTPVEVLTEEIDWTDDGGNCPVLATGETITGVTLSYNSPSGDTSLVLNSQSPEFTNTTTTAWISAGTAGVVYFVTFVITTSASRTISRTLTVFCNANNSL